MKVTLFRVLLGIFVLTLVLFIFTYLVPLQLLRVLLGIPFLLFFPGFVLLTVIAPERDDMSTTDRIVLSLVLSIVADSFIGFILHYTASGITLESVLFSMTIFVVFFIAAGFVRLAMLSREEEAMVDFSVDTTPASGALNAAFLTLMAVVVIGALVAGVYFALAPKSDESFTQFYIVKQDRGALYSPAESSAGDRASVVVGITNNEGDRVDYRVRATVNGERYTEIDSIALNHGQQWQEEITFPVPASGEKQIEFLLFKNQENEPYLNSLRLWISPAE